MVEHFQYAASVFKRKRYDRSFSPAACRKKGAVSFAQYFFWSLLRRKKRSIYKLLNTYYQLSGAYPADSTPKGMLRGVEKAIKREVAKVETHASMVSGNESLSKDDLSAFAREGGIILKAPRFKNAKLMEKGVLLIRWGRNFRSFRRYVNVDQVMREYAIVLEPGWSGLSNFNIIYFTRFFNHPVIVQAAEKRDYQFLKRLDCNLVPVGLGPNDWINPSVFRPDKNREKRYDAVMIARWDMYKRHHVLFRCLRRLSNPTFKVALVSLSFSNRREIELLIDGYGVRDNIRIFEGLPQEGVNKILNQSKVNLLLSLKEGANQALIEGFFADVPGVALKNNVGVQKAYFTSQTGRLIDEKELIPTLLYFRDHWSSFNPRNWAMLHVTPEITTLKLNNLLRDLSVKRGECWATDIVAKCNSPNPEYYPDDSVGSALPLMRDVVFQHAASDRIRNLLI
jgi:glycosyltransferase involved in cell wall biosynthesis